MSQDAPELTAELVADGVVPPSRRARPAGAGLPASSLRPGQGPHSGDGTCDLTGHALRQLAERRAAWPGDDLTASLIDQAERFPPELVTSARLNGHTGHDIAQALATSPDEARRRSDPDSPAADGRWPCDT